jgi:pimeloyl-ACP methyl ester carboxylesterase
VSAPGLTGGATGLGEDVWFDGDGVRLHAVSAGRGPAVLLLHGFPDCWYGWRAQLPALAAAGFRAVALDLRGYNLSERPRDVAAYRMAALVADAAAVARAVGGGAPVRVVGHDWGGAVAWQLASRHPELVERLVVCNAPHPDRFAELLRTPAQAARSWYMGAVQVPLLPELVLGAAGRRILLGVLGAAHRRPAAFTAEDRVRYRAAFAGPWGVRGPLAYYRAAARHPGESFRTERRVARPTLVLWGQEDPALLPENADGLGGWVPDLRVERFPGAGHWVMADAAEAVNRALVGFLAGAA